MQLWLVRHGETIVGEDGLYLPHHGLTELGREQARAVAEGTGAARFRCLLFKFVAASSRDCRDVRQSDWQQVRKHLRTQRDRSRRSNQRASRVQATHHQPLRRDGLLNVRRRGRSAICETRPKRLCGVAGRRRGTTSGERRRVPPWRHYRSDYRSPGWRGV